MKKNYYGEEDYIRLLEKEGRDYIIKIAEKLKGLRNVIYLLEIQNGRGHKNNYYTGKSKNTALQRLYTHLIDKNDSVRQNMELYGTKKIKVHILEYNIDPDKLDEREKYWIEKTLFSGKRMINRAFNDCPKAIEYFKSLGYKDPEYHCHRKDIVQYC